MTQHWHWHWGQKNIDIDIDIEGLFEKIIDIDIEHWVFYIEVFEKVYIDVEYPILSMLCKELFVSSHFFETPDSHVKMALFSKEKSHPLFNNTGLPWKVDS